MYDDILLPIAVGEVEANPSIERALSLAEKYDAAVHVLSVVDSTVYDPMTPNMGTVHDSLEEAAEAAVDAAAETARSHGIDVDTTVGHGTPHSVITEYAEDHADIIVMATHGREGLDHVLLGSVTEKVVRTAEVPVLTVPLP